MEDNRKEESNRYETLASFLDDRSVIPGETDSRLEEEARKLTFLWDECEPSRLDTGEVWNKTLAKIRREEAKKAIHAKRRPAFIFIGGWVAASLAILLGGDYFLDQRHVEDEKGRMEQFMLANAADDDVDEVTLVVSDKKKIEIANNSKVAYTSAGQVQVNSAQLDEAVAMDEIVAEEKEEEYNRIIVPKGRRSMIVLADNSKIWINSGSKVIYPRTFSTGKRQIFVEGEVFLKVACNEAKPFVVSTSAFEVEVLGTSFNISAHKGSSQADVVLVEGAVDVKDHLERHIKMQPNERVELNEAGIAKKESVNALDYIHWVDGVWVLDGKPLKEVIRYLVDYYGRPIHCDPSVENELCYGKLFLNEELDKVLESIRQTLPEVLSARKDVVYINNNE
mgnify:FL=1